MSEHHRKTATLPSANPSKSFWHVEPSALLLGHRSTRDLPEQADVVIVGSGITGTSVAWHLLQNGDNSKTSETGDELNIVMMEAREACWGATGRNGGHCQPILFEHPTDPSIGYFELQNLETITKLCSEMNIDCEFNAQQGIRALYSRADLDGAIEHLETLKNIDSTLAQHMRLVTDPVELLALRVPTATGAIVTDVAARLWPYKFVSHMLESLLTSNHLPGNFNLQTHTPVTTLEPSNGLWKVETPRGSVLAKKVVLATNAYTSFLLKDYADLIVPARGQMSSLLPPPQLAGENRLRNSFGFLGPAQDDYLVQRDSKPRGGGNEQLLYGGGRSQGLSLNVCDDETIDPNTARYLRGALNTLLGVDEATRCDELKATHEWTGIMGFSRDNKPFVGPVADHDGLYISAGYTGHGMPNAWLCGRAVAVMVSEAVSGALPDAAVSAAVQAVGLPRAYIPDKARVSEARKAGTVEEQDHLGCFQAEHA